MTSAPDFVAALEAKVAKQLASQRVGYLLGAGSSYLSDAGYPLAQDVWGLIQSHMPDTHRRAEIQLKLDAGASSLEAALDLLDDGGAEDTPYRHLVASAVGDAFMMRTPPLDAHREFVRRLAQRADPALKIFTLNYDPLIERAAARERVRLVDGFLGFDDGYFDAAAFDERIGIIRATHRDRKFDETVRPLHLLKLHGSLGWYECHTLGIRRCGFTSAPPTGSQRLMIPPQRRKAVATMLPPYSALWSAFRGCLIHGPTPVNRLVCLGYGFGDEHVNAVIEPALARTDFTLLILTKALSDAAWERWSGKKNAVIVTEARSALNGTVGPGHADLWSFERLAKEA